MATSAAAGVARRGGSSWLRKAAFATLFTAGVGLAARPDLAHEKYIQCFPFIETWSDRNRKLHKPPLLSQAEGDVLELGAKIGANTKWLVKAQSYTATEERHELAPLIRETAGANGFPDTTVHAQKPREYLATLPDNSVPCIITDRMLSRDSDVESLVKEIYRVLRPGGYLFFMDRTKHDSAPIGVIQQVISFIPNILFGRGIDRPVKQAITSTFGSAVYMEDWTRAKDNRVGVKVVVQPPIVKLRPYYVDVMDTYSAQDFEIIEREADPLTMSLVPFVAGFAMKKFPEYTDEEIRYQMIENTMAGSRQKEHVVL